MEFLPDGKSAWVGNFQPGITDYFAVLPHLEGKSLIVIAGGQAYVIDPEERCLSETFGGNISIAFAAPQANLLVLGNGIWLEAWTHTGLRWRSRRISWDGMSDLRLENDKVRGAAWSPIDDCEYPFAVDLATGVVEGGCYDVPPIN